MMRSMDRSVPRSEFCGVCLGDHPQHHNEEPLSAHSACILLVNSEISGCSTPLKVDCEAMAPLPIQLLFLSGSERTHSLAVISLPSGSLAPLMRSARIYLHNQLLDLSQELWSSAPWTALTKRAMCILPRTSGDPGTLLNRSIDTAKCGLFYS